MKPTIEDLRQYESQLRNAHLPGNFTAIAGLDLAALRDAILRYEEYSEKELNTLLKSVKHLLDHEV